MKKLNIEEVHNHLLEISKEVHTICVEENIPYYMLGGTMLGAIRHNGFIPWDDDMDIGIPRNYYVKFLSVAEKRLSEKYNIKTIQNSEHIIFGFAKIEDSTTYIDNEFINQNDEKLGLNIDIFPLDGTPKNRIYKFLIIKLLKILKITQGIIFNRYVSHSKLREIFSVFFRFIFQCLPQASIPNLIDKLVMKCPLESSELIANYYGRWKEKEIMPKYFFRHQELYKFENITLYGPIEYDLYLKNIYGDYMQLPPKEKRSTHFENIFAK